MAESENLKSDTDILEFNSFVENGIILIPDEYKNKFFGKVKIILIPEAVESKPSGREFNFPYFAADTAGYVFDREEANER